MVDEVSQERLDKGPTRQSARHSGGPIIGERVAKFHQGDPPIGVEASATPPIRRPLSRHERRPRAGSQLNNRRGLTTMDFAIFAPRRAGTNVFSGLRFGVPIPANTRFKVPSITHQDGVTIVVPGSDYENFNEAEIETLRNTLFEAASHADPPLVVLDLSNLRFFGSAFIEALFRAWTQLHTRPGGRLSLCGLTAYCREVVEVTHLDRLWSVFETRDDAIRSLRHG